MNFFSELKRRNVLRAAAFYAASAWLLVQVATQVGEPDRAIAALQKLLSIPYRGALAENVPLTPALLRLDPLRNDPRFQKLCDDKPK